MPNIDTSKVKAIAGEMIDINNRYKDDFSAVEQAINRLRTDWQQQQKVSTAAFACFDEIKAKFFEPSITERREIAQFLCDAVGIGYEEAENTNKRLLEGLFDVVGNVIANTNSSRGTNYSNSDIQRINTEGIAEFNSSYKTKEGYISSGCLITSVANLYRRKQALYNVPQTEWVTKQKVYEYNNNSAYYSGSTSNVLLEKTGYKMVCEETKDGLTIEKLKELLENRPEGVCVFANGDDITHAILITSIENGNIKVVDPSDGGNPIFFNESSAVRYKCSNGDSIFYSWSANKLLSNITSVRYIK